MHVLHCLPSKALLSANCKGASFCKPGNTGIGGGCRYVRPRFVGEGAPAQLKIVQGRHPVLDVALDAPVVPNDTQLAAGGPSALVITGPNMGGKSCYIRQAALIAIMAQVALSPRNLDCCNDSARPFGLLDKCAGVGVSSLGFQGLDQTAVLSHCIVLLEGVKCTVTERPHTCFGWMRTPQDRAGSS